MECAAEMAGREPDVMERLVDPLNMNVLKNLKYIVEVYRLRYKRIFGLCLSN